MKKLSLSFITVFLIPGLVQAHELGHGGGFTSGLSHPVLGLDHLLAMLAVGILSAQIGGRAVWSVPTAFVGVMLIGGLMGMNGVPFFSVELGIALSVLVLGIALAAEKKLPTYLAMLAVGFFAIFHGHAHGTEMPEMGEPVFYAVGFVIGTALIHFSGVSVGVIAQNFSKGPQFLRYLGAGIAGIGFHLIVL
ncbi:HupE/UreJ family protein [Kiritimatiellota bacterium B12222]|nr:HupE/UreJ family protein [Kiritimatiellota bacterium B12222]